MNAWQQNLESMDERFGSKMGTSILRKKIECVWRSRQFLTSSGACFHTVKMAGEGLY